MEKIRTEHASILIDNKIYILGGYDKKDNQFLKECEIFNIKDNVIENMSSM